MMKLTFIGTGGGRFATILQKRATGGIYVADRGILIHIDPGPGALVKMYELGLDPTQTDAILVSHCHPDHYTDAEILMEAMTMGGKYKRGIVAGSESVLNGKSEYRPLSDYHQSLVREIKVVHPGDEFMLKDWYKVEVMPARHSDSTTVGFKMHLSNGIISYTSDTEFFEELIDAHKGARILIVCMTRPLEGKIPFHMSAEDAAKLIEGVKPEFAILTHLGMKVIPRAAEQATWITEKTGVSTIAAQDGMRIYAGEKLEVKRR
ncbi:MAG: MBL fold metallo-hydrolase [Candidatus Thermoplasmatota archaeon]|nr:MBL fold metallo-hydrolase [Candidatus Thermoplasmatota archaeon]